jgi:hypothetical protein
MSTKPSSYNVITRNELEWKGVTYIKDSPIEFKTLKGKFLFKSWEENLETGTSWVNVFEVNRCWRAFRLEEIKKPKVKKNKKGKAPAGLCPEHKMYTAQRKPRTGCLVCWDAYNDKHDR